MLADAFAESVRPNNATEKERSVDIKFVIETHSEALINRLGELVFDGRLSSNDVQVIIFGERDSAGEDCISVAKFDENGALQNWPFGFFSHSI